MINKQILRAFKSCDLEKLWKSITSDKSSVIRFGVLNHGKEIFLQLCCDRDIRLNDYMQCEKKFIKFSKKLFEGQGETGTIAFALSNSDDIYDNHYARMTMSAEERRSVSCLCDKYVLIEDSKTLVQFLKIGCREIGSAFLYSPNRDIGLMIDGLGGTMWSKDTQKLQAVFNSADFEYTSKLYDNSTDVKKNPLYDEETNQYESMQRISFQVPEAWEKEVDETDCLEYSQETQEGDQLNCLIVGYLHDVEFHDEKEKCWRSLKTMEKKKDIKNFECSTVPIAGLPTVRMEYVQEQWNVDIVTRQILLQTKNGVISIEFFSFDKTGPIELEKVIESIAIGDDK